MEVHHNNISFICDDNLGKLAKFLRICGYDTLFFRTISDGKLIAKALAEYRYVISRDKSLLEKGAPSDKLILLESTDPEEQLRSVLNKLSLHPKEEDWFRRCLECNTILDKVAKEDYVSQIPPYVYKTHDRFHRCPSCGRLYWKGTHYQRMVERIKNLLN